MSNLIHTSLAFLVLAASIVIPVTGIVPIMEAERLKNAPEGTVLRMDGFELECRHYPSPPYCEDRCDTRCF